MIYLSEIFWRCSQDVSTLILNNSEILVCLSVCSLAYFLTEIRQIQGYLLFLMIYLSDIFWRHTWDIFTLFPNNFKFLVCLSVHQLAYFHNEIRPIQGYLLFWMRYLSENFWTHYWDFFTLFPNKCNFFVCLSVCQLLKLEKYRDISGPEGDIFLKFFGDIPGMLVHHFQIIMIFFMSVSLLVGLFSY